MIANSRATTVVAALLATCSVTACGTSEPEPGVNTPEQAAAELEAEAARMAGDGLVLPDEEEWPASGLVGAEIDGEPVVYFVGYGTLQANEYWRCRWQAAALERSGLDRAAALEVLAHYAELPAVATFASDGLSAFDASLQDAFLGDMSAIQYDTDLNCSFAADRDS